MDGEVDVAQLAPRWGLGLAMPNFGQRQPEHISVEARYPPGLRGDEDDAGDELHIFRS
jgi:hypothetical protein